MKIIMITGSNYYNNARAVVELDPADLFKMGAVVKGKHPEGDATDITAAFNNLLAQRQTAIAISNGQLSVSKFVAGFAEDLKKTVEAQLAMTAAIAVPPPATDSTTGGAS